VRRRIAGLVVAALLLAPILLAVPAAAQIRPDAPEEVKCFLARVLRLFMFVGMAALLGALFIAGLYYMLGKPQPERMGWIIAGGLILAFGPVLVSYMLGMDIQTLFSCG